MSPRKASLRVAHQQGCANATKTRLESVGRGSGCTCSPSYYTFHRDRGGKVVKGKRVKDRQIAERSLRKVQVDIDEGRVGIRRHQEKTFAEWADEFLDIKRSSPNVKESTLVAYGPTINYCNAVFGTTPLREIGQPELRALVKSIRDRRKTDTPDAGYAGGSDATVAKHLRQLGAILQQAYLDRLMEENPVPAFKKQLKLKIPAGVPPFTDVELAQLWAKMESEKVPGVYVTACKLAVTTGARAGEIAALNLDDVDLLNGTLRIAKHYDPNTGELTLPKDGEARTVHLIAPARAILESWIADHGGRPGDEPLFTAPRLGNRLNMQHLSGVVSDTMEKTGIPAIGEGGRRRKPLHSLRATYARLMLEQGRHPEWVRRELGHEDLSLTANTYGEWGEAAKQAEASLVESAGFPV